MIKLKEDRKMENIRNLFTRQNAGRVVLRHHVALLLGQLARPLQVGVRVLVAQRGEQRVGAVALCLQGTISSLQQQFELYLELDHWT